MFLLSFIPDAWLLKATTMLVGVGGIGFVIFTILGNIPGVKLSAIILKWVSLVVLCVGCYFTGAYSKDMLWRAEADKLKADMDRKVAEADKRSKQIVTKYVTQTKVIKEKGNEIKKLSQHVKESDAKCIVPKSFVLLHDSAAKNEVPDTSKGIDGSASGVNLSTVGETISINYNNYHQLSEQLKALQDWVTSQEKIYNGK
jgi:uncharacterized membrane-anchored protein YhcB (DUF1043 family)